VVGTNQELQALKDNGTSKIVNLHNGKNIIGCKSTYRIKYKSNGSLINTKQVFWHCEETYSRTTTVRDLLDVVGIKKLMISQMDMSKALLCGH